MSNLQNFIYDLYTAGWTAPCDAQHEKIKGVLDHHVTTPIAAKDKRIAELKSQLTQAESDCKKLVFDVGDLSVGVRGLRVAKEELQQRIDVLVATLESLVLIVGLSAIKYPSDLAKLQVVMDDGMSLLKEAKGWPSKENQP